jgi:regulator of nucleoside diphosphate kinase
MNKQIYITKNDNERLMELLKEKRPHDTYDEALLHELKRGIIVDSKKIPADVITMNSQVKFTEIESNASLTYWLVFPQDADISKNKISILSPIGCGLLGYKVNDIIPVKTPTGEKMVKVEKIIHQPEAEGNYDL